MNCKSYCLDQFIRETQWLFHPPEDADEYHVKRERVIKAIVQVMKKELSERQLDCFRSVVIEQKTVTETALRLGLNKSTVSRHLRRAKEKIQQALKYSFLW